MGSGGGRMNEVRGLGGEVRTVIQNWADQTMVVRANQRPFLAGVPAPCDGEIAGVIRGVESVEALGLIGSRGRNVKP